MFSSRRQQTTSDHSSFILGLILVAFLIAAAFLLNFLASEHEWILSALMWFE
jgi:hypothetical protein